MPFPKAVPRHAGKSARDFTMLHLESDLRDWWLKKDKEWLTVLSEALQTVQKHSPITYRIRVRLSRAVENTSMTDIFLDMDGGNSANNQLWAFADPQAEHHSDDDLFMGDFLTDLTV
ncbi:uncharacterized protein Z518_08945 [Rhinocladiella mackenziei CBS 650.93]|uniref:Uncharacterized protein n=1 Tax=Rhinocladiella mackenziei CBS 650.93 TaxID=1442369 RepID=A0A0D2IX92_9EURO|nr:uncharacterized protein Z518_08945 [Rhinocladiella mackenziei CBS 650.93]KIX01220.1 hypothetical protein Z518_08945 [Rhinocladiella mackenziei CBS 650.93]